MKKALIALTVGALTMGAAHSATNMTELSKDLAIMSSILKTALQQGNDDKGIRFRDLDVSYLADQGVVFEVNTTSGGWNFSFDFGDIMNVLPVAPPAPVVDSSFEKRFVINIDEDDYKREVEMAVEHAQDAMREARDQLRELRNRERELSWEQREYERRRRDIEFEKSHADEEDRKELEQEIKELDKEQKQLETKRQEIDKYATEIEKEQQKQVKATKEAQEKYYKAFLARFEENVADVLCKYGAGVKSMPDDEHVSFVLNGFGEGTSRSRQDKIYVFKNKDIKSCVAEKIDTNKLLANAQTYVF
ncbi:hypothetical protein [Neptunicella sp. SCSIO 80796]|uniref:hypothetical protein n=1 Tax=Neptunicella plasticusilytica TaxID=3117012 RepID=UPI003A4E084B